MTGDDGARLSRELMSHGLLVKRSAIPLIESVDNLDQLIQAALEKSIRLLDDSSVRSLIQSGSNFMRHQRMVKLRPRRSKNLPVRNLRATPAEFSPRWRGKRYR